MIERFELRIILFLLYLRPYADYLANHLRLLYKSNAKKSPPRDFVYPKLTDKLLLTGTNAQSRFPNVLFLNK